MSTAPWILAGRGVLVDARTWLEGGGLWIERGRIRRLLATRGAVLRARARVGRSVELEDRVLTPGLVNAHAHLDLGSLHGRVSAQGGFVAWVRALVAERRTLAREDFERGVITGARALLASGTTAVGDIDASGASASLAASLGLRIVVHRELLDAWDPARTEDALGSVRRKLRATERVREGLSPHAPYTTSPGLLAGARAVARRRGLSVTIHWAETSEEREWLERARGPLAEVLPASPRRSGLELLRRAGMLSRHTSLVHGNDPRAEELALLARRGVTLVHCPGTHAFFDRPRFPLARVRAAGVPLALGTDSLASNETLDLRREMALLRAAFPRLAPAEIFTLATEGGARALAWPGLGHLRVGAQADVVAWRSAAEGPDEALEELTAALPPVERVFIAGRAVEGPGN